MTPTCGHTSDFTRWGDEAKSAKVITVEKYETNLQEETTRSIKRCHDREEKSHKQGNQTGKETRHTHILFELGLQGKIIMSLMVKGNAIIILLKPHGY